MAWKDELGAMDEIPLSNTGNPYLELDMVLHDCAQYLTKAEGDRRPAHLIPVPWADPSSGTVSPTVNPYSLVARARMLKDICIRLAGGEPLGWQTNGPPDLE